MRGMLLDDSQQLALSLIWSLRSPNETVKSYTLLWLMTYTAFVSSKAQCRTVNVAVQTGLLSDFFK